MNISHRFRFCFVLLVMLSISGCMMNGKPDYQCEIMNADPSNPDCAATKGMGHICQIYDNSYSPEQGIPSQCTKKCLKRSEVLNSVPEKCVQVNVSVSHFSERAQELGGIGHIVASQILNEAEELMEEEEEVFEGTCSGEQDSQCFDNCTEKTDFDCCISTGKCWIGGTCTECSNGECEFDSDCNPECDGDVLWKKGCNLQTATCERTFSTNCAESFSDIEGKKVSQTCLAESSTCGIDKRSYKEQYDLLQKEYNELSAARQEVTKTRQEFENICLNTLSNITNQFIIDVALTFRKIPTSSFAALTIPVREGIRIGIEEITDQKMSPEEVVAWSCNQQKVLTTELQLLSKKQEKLMDRMKPLRKKF